MLDSGPVPRTRPESQRWLGLALGGVAMVALALGILTRSMLVDNDGYKTIHCGLRSCEGCVEGEGTCADISTLTFVDAIKANHGEATAVWGWSGMIAFVAAIVGLVGLGLAILMVATRRYQRIPLVSPTTLALLGGAVGLICACIFLVTKPETNGVTRVGWTFWSFGVGTILTIVSAFMLSRGLGRLEPEFDPGESPDQPTEEPWQDV